MVWKVIQGQYPKKKDGGQVLTLDAEGNLGNKSDTGKPSTF